MEKRIVSVGEIVMIEQQHVGHVLLLLLSLASLVSVGVGGGVDILVGTLEVIGTAVEEAFEGLDEIGAGRADSAGAQELDGESPVAVEVPPLVVRL